MRRTATLIAALLASTLLTSCQVSPGTGESNFNLLSADDEAKMGAEAHPDILKQFGGAYDDPKVQAYVAGVGKRLVAGTETPNATFRFTVLNSTIVNAMATPGGYVYVTRGLLALADDEAEVAGVIGHEIGHVTARHTAQRYSRAMAANVATGVLGAVVGALTGVSGAGDVAQLGAAAYIQGFSRDQESQADQLGIRYMNNGGWNPQYMATFLNKLRQQAQLEAVLAGRPADEVDQYSMWASHPRTVDRVKDAAEAVKFTDHQGAVGHESYLARMEGLLVGDDPDEGVIRGHTFSHAGLGIRFDVPKGFRLINGANEVNAINPDGAQIRFDLGAEASGDMTNYLQTQWGKGVRLSSIEALDINGMPAATGLARVNTNKGTMDARLLAVKNGKATYRFLYLTPPGVTAAHAQEFKAAGLSLRKLSEAEKAEMKPLRIKVITVKAGDTVEGLAERLPYDDHKVERFRVLNDLKEGEALKPGTRLKTVI